MLYLPIWEMDINKCMKLASTCIIKQISDIKSGDDVYMHM